MWNKRITMWVIVISNACEIFSISFILISKSAVSVIVHTSAGVITGAFPAVIRLPIITEYNTSIFTTNYNLNYIIVFVQQCVVCHYEKLTVSLAPAAVIV